MNLSNMLQPQGQLTAAMHRARMASLGNQKEHLTPTPMKQPIVRIVPFKRFEWDETVEKNRTFHYFRFVARNGEIVMANQKYRRASSRDKTVKMLAGAKIVVAK